MRAIAAAARVARMLEQTPAVVGYLRRALLDATGHKGTVLAKLTDLTAQQVASMRTAGLASTDHPDDGKPALVIGVADPWSRTGSPGRR